MLSENFKVSINEELISKIKQLKLVSLFQKKEHKVKHH